MARLLDVASSPVSFGYWYTESFAEITFYLNELLNQFGISFLCTCHASSIFVNNAGERQELHMAALRPTLFDPADPPEVFDDKIQNLFDALNNPEAYDNIEGSGWTIIPNTTTYWVNTIAYQPNNNPSPNGRNSVEPPTDDDPDDPAVQDDVSQKLNDTFLLCLGAAHVERKRHHTRLLYRKLCERWVESQGLTPPTDTPKITPSTLASWQERVFDYNLRVFSEHGNVIYHKELRGEIINLLWKNRKFSLIENLHALFKEKLSRNFCGACKKFHSSEELCKNTIKAARSENVYVPEMPRSKHNVVIYADFESYIDHNNHKPSGYCLVMVSRNTIINECRINALDTDDVAQHFIKTLIQFCNNYAVQCTVNTNICGICEQRVTGGDYILGKNYINGAEGKHHKDCWDDIHNCAYVFFHNFRGYDSHYVLSQCMEHCNIHTLRGKSFEKFDLISCTSGQFSKFTFKDSFNFLPSSLAKLVPTVVNWRHTPPEGRNSKGLFPYDWFDSPSKLCYTSLPVPEFWFNKLTQTQVDPTDAYALWKEKKFSQFHEFHDYYMRLDVLQLTDIFEEFRDAVFDEFRLDPVYCQGAPSLTWQLCLDKYGDKIKVITDTKIYLDIQSNIRGGMAQVSTRHKSVEKSGGSLLYLDINSLYSSCMEHSLPTSFVNKLDSLPDDWEKYAGEGPETALICVDLHYPEHLHDKHRFLPLAPHRYNNRLCATFVDRENYLCHARNLKYYLDMGMVLIKCHYLYVFKQDKVLKEYVNMNIQKRRETDSPVYHSIYKLLNNSLYGKTCENKLKYHRYGVKDPFVGIHGKRNPFMFKSRNWLEVNGKILCELDVNSVTLDKPMQMGFTILEFAKLAIYEFYFLLLMLFPELELCYHDTDSFLIWIPEENPQYRMIDSPLATMLDFEKAPSWFGVVTTGTDKQTGLWSLEAKKPIVEFVGLRAKTYAIRFADGTTTLKNKGVISTALEESENRPLEFDDYLKCLFQDEDIYVEQVMIRSKLHNISTITQKKLALSSLDEKRVILADKVTTLPYGYRGEIFNDNNVIQQSSDNL